jgi:aspartate racemase
MFEFSRQDVIGVVGGMGPMASAEFLKTIYECSQGEQEQDFPVVMVYSDPTFPDRTTAFRSGRADEVLQPLMLAFNRLLDIGATKLMMCCMTSHHLLPQFPAHVHERLISLLDIIFEQLAKSDRRHLLICSTGTREFQLFEKHSRWESLKSRIILPDEAEQRSIHRDLIYPIKKNPDTRELHPILESLMCKYETDSFIAGCSEIHLVAKQLLRCGASEKKYSCIDPLMILAREIAKERL